ncbi:hypothetical protein [Streptomyces sp. CoH27]|uniref:hypothetical protein n=1 Tax=Streptomyces sp. CoH27 TaxID=2875763 RepID=UPI001CD72333|nr:hypothetical protein [Streptomyces sp. CoH27]
MDALPRFIFDIERKSEMIDVQRPWSWCSRCQGFFFIGNAPNLGNCPSAEGFRAGHDGSASTDYVLAEDNPGHPGFEGNWHFCKKCQQLFWAGRPSNFCPAGGSHIAGGTQYMVSKAHSGPWLPGQTNWFRCSTCAAMFFAGTTNPENQGVCPGRNGRPHIIDNDPNDPYSMLLDPHNTPFEGNRLIVFNSILTTSNWTSAGTIPMKSWPAAATHLGPARPEDNNIVLQGASPSPNGNPFGEIGFHAFLINRDVHVSWYAQEMSDEIEDEQTGEDTIVENGGRLWSGIQVRNHDPIDADWTDMEFYVLNRADQAWFSLPG